ncbi:MAG: hypothetical protein JXA77_14765 [Bacteroidales bacterium]|nr:hypothetical protein [Bacteroidales bacterium]MBN2818645.1 hypothetical protein [Bacteroidales bacterium]
MRKFNLIILFAVIYMFSLNAQESPGKYAVEMNFNPASLFDALAGTMFTMPQISGKYFLYSDMAVRLGVDMGVYSNKSYSDADGDNYQKDSGFDLTIYPGIEKRFGSEKLVVLVGGELPLGWSSTKRTTTMGGNTTIYNNINGGGINVGLHAVLGGEFYLFPNFYIGAVFTPGLDVLLSADQKTDNDITQKGGNSASFNLSSSSGLKIGLRF